jgi:DHA1 family multidrug resistance protein-like MFS transporter
MATRLIPFTPILHACIYGGFMARFLFCSFALVLLYPSGIDMYLVGLPHIARDLGASEAQLHIAFSAYLAGMASSMVFAGKIADKAGRQPVAITGAIIFALARSLLTGAGTAPCSWPDVLFRALERVAATWWPLPFCATP